MAPQSRASEALLVVDGVPDTTPSTANVPEAVIIRLRPITLPVKCVVLQVNRVYFC